MPGLFDSLTMAARSLHAQQYAMDVTGQNIGNVNTPGYTRRVVEFADVPRTAGGGVEIKDVRSVRDTLIERRLLRQVPVGSRDAALADVLAVVETALGKPGASLDAQLDTFFNAFSDLAEDPTSPVARRQVQQAGQALAASFTELGGRLEAGQRDADSRVRTSVAAINTLTTRIAEINDALPAAEVDGSALTLHDEQQQLVRQLAELADVHVIARREGGVDVTIGNGRPLVVGANTYAIEITPTAEGFAALSSRGAPLDPEIAGGTLGGLLYARDTVIPSYEASLDTLAFETAAQVNAIHAAGFDLSGAAGSAFFSFSVAPVGVAGAARALRVDPAIVADNSTIAAAGVAEVADNGAARAMAALRHERVLNGGTLHEAWGSFIYVVGSEAQAAAAARDTQQDIIRQVDAMRDQVSGVSLDEEALNLMKFQRAYEANAKFFTAVDRMLVTLLNIVG